MLSHQARVSGREAVVEPTQRPVSCRQLDRHGAHAARAANDQHRALGVARGFPVEMNSASQAVMLVKGRAARRRGGSGL